ncbi:HD domain-containing protein [Acidobacteria bacterium AH-259-A15]|nr:HD domain-containing protein [Acidobacteria bacterium AH-259-A15]
MEAIKNYLIRNFERTFVLFILISVIAIHYLIPYKLAFLNFYFIPILLGAFYLGVRQGLLGAILCTLLVIIFAYVFPARFMMVLTPLDLWMNILAWSSFLILTGAVVGKLTTRLREEVKQVRGLNKDLEDSKAKIEASDEELKEYAENLEKKVTERTESLEKSKVALEDLKGKVEEALYSTMDASVVKLIIEKRLRTEKRRISIMFSDLKDFTQFSEERRPEVVINDLNRLLQEMEGVLLDYHAHIDKYLGDGIMVEFGAPTDYERHALLAVVAGLKMQERISKGKFPWQMRVGIATGEPIIGLIGYQRQTYTAIGDVVNLAARIQEMTTPGLVTVDSSTYEEVSRFVESRRKTVLSFAESEDPEFVKKVADYSKLLDENPDDVELLKKAGLLFLEGNYILQAHEHLGKALGIDSKDDKIKLAYAETTLKMNQMDAVSIRGRKDRLHLYEILGLNNPLLDREKIPERLYQQYHEEVSKALEYPEDIVLPVEVIDGSIGHSRVVGFLAYGLAEVLNLTDQEKLDVLQAGYLSDVGKTIIPHHLLNRAGALSKREFEEVVKHSRESVRLLKKMGYQNESLFEIIDASHEAFNGAGYPSGLEGENIPLGARIIAVADSYDALTSWRPYRDRWDYGAAFSELERDAQKGKFDPKVMEVLGALLEIRPQAAVEGEQLKV